MAAPTLVILPLCRPPRDIHRAWSLPKIPQRAKFQAKIRGYKWINQRQSQYKRIIRKSLKSELLINNQRLINKQRPLYPRGTALRKSFKVQLPLPLYFKHRERLNPPRFKPHNKGRNQTKTSSMPKGSLNSLSKRYILPWNPPPKTNKTWQDNSKTSLTSICLFRIRLFTLLI